MTYSIQRPMSKGLLLAKLIGLGLARKRKTKQNLVTETEWLSDNFSPLAIRINNLSACGKRLQRFKQLFDCEQLPSSYLFIESYRYIGQLLLQAKLPSGLIGLIHLNANFEQIHQVDWQLPFDLALSLTECEVSEKGLIYGISLELFQADKLCMTSAHQVLDKFKGYQRRESVRQFRVSNALSAITYQSLTQKLARRYANVSGDYNPIHLKPWLARLLGMKTCVMHGMYQLHWALVNSDQTYRKVDAAFNKACYLPRKISLVKQGENQLAVFSNHFTERHMLLTLG